MHVTRQQHGARLHAESEANEGAAVPITKAAQLYGTLSNFEFEAPAVAGTGSRSGDSSRHASVSCTKKPRLRLRS